MTFWTSPVPRLYVEANEPSLYDRIIKLAMQYITKLHWNPSNPAYGCVFNPMCCDHHDKTKHTDIRTLGLKPHIASAGFNTDITSKFRVPDEAPWLLRKSQVRIAFTGIRELYMEQAIIFSDSLSCLQALKNGKSDHPFILEILRLHQRLLSNGCNILY